VQTTIEWIFWDPGSLARYAKLDLPGDLGSIAARSTPFAERLEPACEKLLARVDETAGPNYQAASRIREPR
jgi:hypothetical protein